MMGDKILIHGLILTAVRCPKCPGNALVYPASDLARHIEAKHNDVQVVERDCKKCGAHYSEKRSESWLLHNTCTKCRMRGSIHSGGKQRQVADGPGINARWANRAG